MKCCVILVDNSNIFIEGRKLSAKNKGVTELTPEGKIPHDPSWRIDFGKLIQKVSEDQKIIKAILVGSIPPESDSIWNAAQNKGFDVITHKRNSSGKEKQVDTELAVQGSEIICEISSSREEDDEFILKLLSGDADFLPLIKLANRKNWETEMWAFNSSFQGNGEMAQTVTRVKPLDNIFNDIGKE